MSPRATRRGCLAAAIALVLAAAFPYVAQAQQTSGGAEDHLAGIETQRRALRELIEAGPLVVRRALFVTAVPRRFGEYDPRGGRPFEPGETMLVYIEPVGLVWQRDGEDWRLDVGVGFEIRPKDGKPIVQQPDFGSIVVHNRERPTEVMTYLSLDLKQAPAGPYELTVTLTDRPTAKTASFTLPFSVDGPLPSDSAGLR